MIEETKKVQFKYSTSVMDGIESISVNFSGLIIDIDCFYDQDDEGNNIGERSVMIQIHNADPNVYDQTIGIHPQLRGKRIEIGLDSPHENNLVKEKTLAEFVELQRLEASVKHLAKYFNSGITVK